MAAALGRKGVGAVLGRKGVGVVLGSGGCVRYQVVGGGCGIR